MDWKSTLATIAPALAGAVSGPFAPLAAMATSLISKTLLGKDTATDDEINAAMAVATPDKLIELKKAEQDFQAHLEEIDAQRLSTVNATMQAEAKSEHWAVWGWRPYWGFISGSAFFVICCFVCFLMYEAMTGANKDAFGMIPQVIGAFTALFSVPGAILGIASWHRGMMQREAVKPES